MTYITFSFPNQRIKVSGRHIATKKLISFLKSREKDISAKKSLVMTFAYISTCYKFYGVM
jgi:hypothetical protein